MIARLPARIVRVLPCLACLPFIALPWLAQAAPLRIGDVNSYTGRPGQLDAYRRGLELAVEEINGRGGVRGRSLELLARNDDGDPDQTARLAGELLAGQGIDVLLGNSAGATAAALQAVANRHPVLLLTTPVGTGMTAGRTVLRTHSAARPNLWWETSGCPGLDTRLPAWRRFAAAYRARFGESPEPDAAVGYTAVIVIAAAAERAGSARAEALGTALVALRMASPLGMPAFRDHRATSAPRQPVRCTDAAPGF